MKPQHGPQRAARRTIYICGALVITVALAWATPMEIASEPMEIAPDAQRPIFPTPTPTPRPMATPTPTPAPLPAPTPTLKPMQTP